MTHQTTVIGSHKADQDKAILLLGDLIIDSYVYVDATKISPEAPVPVAMLSESIVTSPGGAGLAAAYASANNIPIVFGTYTNSQKAQWLLNEYNISNMIGCFGDIGKTNAVKLRYIDIDSGYHILRVDNDRLIDKPFLKEIDKVVWSDAVERSINDNNIGGIVVLDYNKGLINTETHSHIIYLAQKHHIPYYIDSRKNDIRQVSYSDIIKLNKKEFEQALAICNLSSIEKLAEKLNAKIIIVTTGATGAYLYDRTTNQTISARPEKTVGQLDVTGCGDVFDITFCHSYITKDMDLRESLVYAVNCACKYAHTDVGRRLKCQKCH